MMNTTVLSIPYMYSTVNKNTVKFASVISNRTNASSFNMSKITILDGGMGHLLRRHGVEIKGKIGSMQRFLGVALANEESPDLVRGCHTEYIDAGAHVITSNSYSCVPAALELAGNGGWSNVQEAIRHAGMRAKEAVDASDMPSRPLVAGCVPPLRESYRYDRVESDEELRTAYGKIVAEIDKYSDLLLCETMSSAREARFAAEAANATGKPVWVSWTLHEDASGKLRSSESIENAVLALKDVDKLEACLLNCCSHESICEAIPQLRGVLLDVGRGDVRIGAYANGFETVHTQGESGETEYRDLSVETYVAQAKAWTDLGASIVGGCCGVFPEHIEGISRGIGR